MIYSISNILMKGEYLVKSGREAKFWAGVTAEMKNIMVMFMCAMLLYTDQRNSIIFKETG